MSPEAEKLWRAAEEYASFADQNLKKPPYPFVDADQVKDIALASYLFPFAPERMRHGLAELRRFGHAIQRAKTGEGSEISHIHMQEGIEQNMQLFTPLQEEIVREKYFLKPGSNK